MKKYTAYLFVLFLLCSEQVSADISQEIEKIRLKNNLPALVAISMNKGEVTHSIALGTRKMGEDLPVNINHRFHLGSCSKAMTATLVARLIEAGKLSWNTKVSEIFPKFKIHKDYDDLTIEHLVVHRSGLTGNLISFGDGSLWKSLWDETLDVQNERNKLAKTLLEHPAASKSLEKFVYSNAGYVVLGAILESVTKKSWESLIQSEIFLPLGMKSCGFGAPNKDEPWPHETKNNLPSPVTPSFYAGNPTTVAPAGGVHCSLPDWSKFILAHIDGYNGNNNILKAKTYQKLHAGYPGQDYTYGAWVKVKRDWASGEAFTHSGSNTLNYATVWFAPKKRQLYLVATNYGGEAMGEALDKVIGVLIRSQK